MHIAQARKSLSAAMIVVLLSCIGMALPYPILAPMFINEINPLTTFASLNPKLLLGFVLAAYPLGVLIGSSVIGAASDHWGRKTSLSISLFISALGYWGSAWSIINEQYLVFVLTRFITGICEGNISIAKAIAADLSPTLDKTRTFSLINATGYAGWLIGPLAGGLLQPFGLAIVFYIAAIITVISIILVTLLLPSQKLPPQRQLSSKQPKQQFRHLFKQGNSFALLKQPAIRQLFIIYFLATLGLNAFYEFYPLLLAEKYQFTSPDIGFITAVLTICMIITSVFGVTQVKLMIGINKGALVGLSLLSVSLLVHNLFSANLLWVFYGVIGVTIALYNGFVPVYISDRFNNIGQGQLMGLLTATFSLSNVVMAILGSLIALIDTYGAIIFGGLLVLLSTLAFKQVLNSSPSDDKLTPELSPISSEQEQ
ncbi:MFS transporter [Colwellia sp. MEBiC06753]